MDPRMMQLPSHLYSLVASNGTPRRRKRESKEFDLDEKTRTLFEKYADEYASAEMAKLPPSPLESAEVRRRRLKLSFMKQMMLEEFRATVRKGWDLLRNRCQEFVEGEQRVQMQELFTLLPQRAAALPTRSSLEEQAKSFQELLLIPDWSMAVFHRVGLALYEQGDLDGAECVLQLLASLDPSQTIYLNQLAVILRAKSQYATAALLFAQSLEIDATQTDIYLLLAVSYLDEGQKAEAQATLAKANNLIESKADEELRSLYKALLAA